MTLATLARRVKTLEAKIPARPPCGIHHAMQVCRDTELAARQAEIAACPNCAARTDIFWVTMGRMIVRPGERPVNDEPKQTTQWEAAQQRVDDFLAEFEKPS